MPQNLKPFHEVVVGMIGELASAGKPNIFTLNVLCEIIADSVVPNPAEMADRLESFKERFVELGAFAHLNIAINRLRRRVSDEAARSESRSNTTAELCGNG